ncbi:DUF3152 domain-containing protein [Kribbella deserti]|uniref:DUF3152 domain-containing protein n=1 Tax=Kribbella deserti TaxID=1926257 RepID=A0ABV6QU87_9ACTN
MSVTALAVLAMVVVVHPDPGKRSSLAVDLVEARVTTEREQLPSGSGGLPTAAPTPGVSPEPDPVIEPTPDPSAQSTVRPPKPAPPNITRSTGRLAIVSGGTKAKSEKNKLTYRLEIEHGLSFSGPGVAEAIHRTLTDERGWQSAHPVNFERTDGPDPDLRIIVATPTLTDKLCEPLDTGGQVSCRVEDRVVLNAKRWAYAVPHYQGKIDLYRAYMVNHEVGHALGFGHSTCAADGKPAPVMMQQTKGLGGCLPNPWPTVNAT